VASESDPESLTVWHDGVVVETTPANTGGTGTPTAQGTFPVYLRLRNQVMRGTDPDGATYADPVQFVAYFNGGDALHYMPRASYGDPQSLGCVELPYHRRLDRLAVHDAGLAGHGRLMAHSGLSQVVARHQNPTVPLAPGRPWRFDCNAVSDSLHLPIPAEFFCGAGKVRGLFGREVSGGYGGRCRVRGERWGRRNRPKSLSYASSVALILRAHRQQGSEASFGKPPFPK
jgi:hypothetical protein